MTLRFNARLATIALTAAMAAAAVPAMAQVMVGGAPMLASKDIIDNAVNSKDHTTLVAAVKAAGLVETLKGPGPFTVFAPTNAAFAALPAGTVDTLLKPESKPTLTKVLTYHVVAGKYDAAALSKMIADGKGMASLKTVAGGTLTAKASGNAVMVTDEKGGTATVTIADNETATVTITANDAAASEAGPDNGQFTVDLGKVNNTGSAITVNYTVTGTAAGGSDYTVL